MSQEMDVYESCSLWPIQIGIDKIDYYTLWGSGGDSTDLVMAIDKQLCLFRRQDALMIFIKNGEKCNFSELPGYASLRRCIMHFDFFQVTLYRFDISEPLSWLKEPNRPWDEKRCRQILDCLNLFWDIANTLNDPASLHLQQQGELQRVANLLTKMSLDQRIDPVALGKLSKGSILKAFRSEYTKIKNHMLVK